jgi:hypothetical protein
MQGQRVRGQLGDGPALEEQADPGGGVGAGRREPGDAGCRNEQDDRGDGARCRLTQLPGSVVSGVSAGVGEPFGEFGQRLRVYLIDLAGSTVGGLICAVGTEDEGG